MSHFQIGDCASLCCGGSGEFEPQFVINSPQTLGCTVQQCHERPPQPDRVWPRSVLASVLLLLCLLGVVLLLQSCLIFVFFFLCSGAALTANHGSPSLFAPLFGICLFFFLPAFCMLTWTCISLFSNIIRVQTGSFAIDQLNCLFAFFASLLITVIVDQREQS